MKQYYVYIVTNHTKTLYVGVTNNLFRRVFEHKNKMIEGFTQKYNINQLVYYERHNDIKLAIQKETTLKGWKREKKLKLIEPQNQLWLDLSDGWYKGL